MKNNKFPPVTLGLIAANLVLFALQLFWGDGNPSGVIYFMGAMSRQAVAGGEWWRLISSAFLHVAIWHLAGNLWVLYQLGSFLESVLGTKRLLVLYAASALGSGLAVQWFSSAGAAAGASGAIWGLMTAYLVIAYRPGRLISPEFAERMKKSALQNLLINVGISFIPMVSASGHFGGGAVGAALLLSGLMTRGLDHREPQSDMAPLAQRVKPPREHGWITAAGLSIAAMSASVLIAQQRGRPWEFIRGPRLASLTLPETRIRVDLPVAQAIMPAKPAAGATNAFISGVPGTSFLYSQIQLYIMPETINAADLTTGMQQIRNNLSHESLPAGASRHGDIESITTHGHSVLRERITFPNNYTVLRSVHFCGGSVVFLDILVAEHSSPAWQATAEMITTSVQCPTPTTS